MKNALIAFLIVALAVVVGVAANPAYDFFGKPPKEVKYFSLSTDGAASGDNTLIAAVSGKNIMILEMVLKATSTTSVDYYLTGGGGNYGTATNPMTLDKDGIDGPAGEVISTTYGGVFRTSTAGAAVVLNLSAETPIVCNGTYIEF